MSYLHSLCFQITALGDDLGEALWKRCLPSCHPPFKPPSDIGFPGGGGTLGSSSIRSKCPYQVTAEGRKPSLYSSGGKNYFYCKKLNFDRFLGVLLLELDLLLRRRNAPAVLPCKRWRWMDPSTEMQESANFCTGEIDTHFFSALQNSFTAI